MRVLEEKQSKRQGGGGFDDWYTDGDMCPAIAAASLEEDVTEYWNKVLRGEAVFTRRTMGRRERQ